MDSVGFVMLLGLALFWAALFALQRNMLSARDEKLPEEQGKLPVHSEICGLRADTYNATIPYARVTVYNDFMVVACPSVIFGGQMRYRLIPSDIVNLEVRRHLISKGLHILHTRKDLPRTLIIWSRDCKKLKNVIEGQLKSVLLEGENGSKS